MGASCLIAAIEQGLDPGDVLRVLVHSDLLFRGLRTSTTAMMSGIPPEAVRHEKMTTRPPPGTGTATGRRALATSHY
jgi:hypothetical protein